MLRRVVIPARDLKAQDGMTFMHVSSVSTYMIALCCSAAHGRRPLSKTNVIEQLIDLRNVQTIANAPPVQEELRSFKDAGCVKVRDRLKNKVMDEISEVATILSPTIGDAQGIEMKILGFNVRQGFNANCAPLYVELDPENIAYLRNACQWQIEHCDFKRHKAQKKVEDSVDVDSDCNHEELGGEHVNDADVEEVYLDNDADVEEVYIDSPQQTESPPQKEDRELQCDPGLETPVKSAERSYITDFLMKRVA